MRRSVILLGFLMGAMTSAPWAAGARLTSEEALARFTAGKQHSPALRRASASTLNLTATVGNLYIFSDRNGYFVLPNEDSAPALLGYSEGCDFDAATNPNLTYWLEFLSKEIDYIAKNPKTVSEKATRPQRAAISPMLTTRWNQSSPYNNDCPVINGSRSVTGCVATAMAQVLKYHNYPEKGLGEASYTWQGQDLSFDYANTTFEWDLMLDSYDSSSSAESQAAVAKLMYGCGVSVEMQYSPAASGAFTYKIPGALIDHFNYDKALWSAQRDAYGIIEWEDLIYNELKENRPVIYGGVGSGGGHEFVCDGYSDEGYFHFNWGWGGMSDGYFLLTALSPGSLGTGGGAGGYNLEQDAVIGVQPAREGSLPTYVMYNWEADFATQSGSAELGSFITFTGDFINCGALEIPSMSMGIKLQQKGSDSFQYVESTSKVTNLGANDFFSSFEVKLPAGLPAGEYVVTPAYRVDGRDWQDLRSFLSVNGRLNATVDGSTITFTAPQKPTLSVANISTQDEIYIGHATPLSYTITNPGTEEYVGEVIPCLVNADKTMTVIGDGVPVDLMGGESVTYTDVPTKFLTIMQRADFTPGTYQLVFRDGAGDDLSAPTDITVKDSPGAATIGVTNFSLASTTPVENKNSVKFNVGVSCSSGYFSNALKIYVFPDAGGYSVYSAETPYFYLNAGQSETKTADLDLSSLANGKYFASVYLNTSPASSTRASFELKDPTTGVEEIDAYDADQEMIYDIYGIRRTRPLNPGLYIINGRKTVIK
ncbi:MAG: C10 family peptidase [Muribaculaceae bacterium]|nr:C10 family peptidase [Muribaculaceae bacterium]